MHPVGREKAVVEQKDSGREVFFHLAAHRVTLAADADMRGAFAQKHLRFVAG